MPLIPLLFHSTESYVDLSLEYQQELLRAVFHEITQVYSTRIFIGTPFTDVTIREEVHGPQKRLTLEYTERYLCVFFVENLRAGNFQIEWMPQSVRTLRVFRSHQRFTLKSRCFPRESLDINLSHNWIAGEIDLETLP